MAETFNPTGEQLYNATRFTHDDTGTVINPATREMQEAQNATLSALGTEATQLLIKAEIEATRAKQDEIKTALGALATESKLELVRLLLADIQSKLGSVDIASMPAISGEVSVSNLPTTQQIAGEVQVTNLPETQKDVVIGLLADRPPASEMRGRGYYAWDETDGHKLKYSDGTNWVVNK